MNAAATLRPASVAALATAGMLAVYAATLAPGVTFWDAGEFIAAAHSLGIPHPPGTPLFVLLLNVWAKVVGFVVSYAVATNLFSAVCTAVAAGASAWLLARRTAAPVAALAGAVCAGAMSTVWFNATETEVYAASLALAMLTLVCADRASRDPGMQWLSLTAYLIALAVPLHLSALVATPAAIVLAAQADNGVDAAKALLLAGVWVVAIAAGRLSPFLAFAGLALIGGGMIVVARRKAAASAVADTARTIAAVAVGMSVVAYLLVRARHDPFINQGNPSTLATLLRVIGRRQYDVAPLWPRQAPWWLQTANLGEWADWQVALGLGPTVLPTIGRTAMTIVFTALGAYGCAAHRRTDRRTWRALVALGVCGSLGVLVYLNLKAGPSFGFGFLPDAAPREARERDYFFALGFWTWGLWAGFGAVMLARRLGRRDVAGLAVAALPLVLNWRSVNRRAEPEASLPRTWAVSLLDATPRRGMLFVVGDNDTYPLWYAQEVLGVRRDVHVVTLPLLYADWYRDELARRGALLESDSGGVPWPGLTSIMAQVATRAEAASLPVAASVYVDAIDRDALGGDWRANGLVFVRQAGSVPLGDPGATRLSVDLARAASIARALGEQPGPLRPSLDPVDGYFQSLLRCPRYLAERGQEGRSTSLDSLCNFR